MIKRFTFAITPDMHESLSIVAVLQKKTIQALILDALSDRLDRDWGSELRRYRAKGEEKK